jgi:hypothetical protein
VEARALAPVQLEAITADETRGRFSDAMRRTRESFAAARLFLNDAFTGFVGAFRRVSPFWAIGTTGPTSY